MGKWLLEHPDGRKIQVEGATMPSDSEIDEMFAGLKSEPQSETINPLGVSSSGMAGRAGGQVLAPKNPRAVLNAAMDFGRVAQALPGAAASVYGDYAVGAAKGLGGMADSAIKALGLPRSDYADAAFSPSNPVQGVGKGLAQAGAVVGASEAALEAMGLSPIGALIARMASSPAGIGVTTAGVSMAEGDDAKTAGVKGAATGLFAKFGPNVVAKIVKSAFPKAGASEVAAATQEAEAFFKAKPPEVPTLEAIKQAQNRYKVERMAAAGKPASRAHSYEQAGLPVSPEVSAAEANRIRPIPPSKLTPEVKPAPKAPEPAPKPAPKASESPAVDAVAKAERQKRHIAESIAKKAEKDAKNVAIQEQLPENMAASLELGKRYPRKSGESSVQWLKRVNSEMKAKAAPDVVKASVEQTPIAKYYQVHPEYAAPEGVVGIHPTLGLPMNAEGKVLVRNTAEWAESIPGAPPDGGLVWRDPNRSFFGNPSVQEMADILKARAEAKAPVLSLEEQMRSFKKPDMLDRMKVPKVDAELAAKQKAALAKALAKAKEGKK